MRPILPIRSEIATRMAAFDFSVMGNLLPNPDPLLKQLGQDIRVYRDIARDPHVGACVRRRKAAVLALSWDVDRGRAASRATKSVQAMLADLDTERLIRQALDACQYGYQPLEVSWRPGTGGLWVDVVEAKPPEWFCFDAESQLRFRTREQPLEGIPLPPAKFLLPRQDASYRNPYGEPDLALCYWPALFKKGGLRFWLTFAEKYGGAFAVGKLPRSAQAAERQEMLTALEGLLQDAVATVPDDGSVEIIESAGKSASSDLYQSLVMHCRGEISIVQTGTNQTMEASSNKASAHAGLDVAHELRDADAAIVTATVNQLIQWVVERNYPGSPAPVFQMWDQEEQDRLQAERDKSNYDAGARYTNAYWINAYGYKPEDLAPEAHSATAPPDAPGASAAAFAEAALAAEPAPWAPEAAQLAAATQPQLDAWLAQLRGLVDLAETPAALQAAMVGAWGHLPTEQLAQLMAAGFALAELRGMEAARADAGPT
ncbi:MAG: DUF935 domain-containing protein [Proteobacteria bacterium]|nr:DUF935 domain-containing protein [Pseudomonadota bacterium]